MLGLNLQGALGLLLLLGGGALFLVAQGRLDDAVAGLPEALQDTLRDRQALARRVLLASPLVVVAAVLARLLGVGTVAFLGALLGLAASSLTLAALRARAGRDLPGAPASFAPTYRRWSLAQGLASGLAFLGVGLFLFR